MEQIAEILISALLVIGGVFGIVGGYGLVKLPDPMTRLHAPTKAATLGVGSVLCGSVLWSLVFGEHGSWHEFLIILFIFLTAPITGLMIAKSHIHRSWQWNELPSAEPDENWATCAPDRAEPDATTKREPG
ncbi:Na+/H+ antiporter subunit G [Paracoccus tegillarcae]|uniref:Na+/H+ antiporter subunit G n=1 Tax=Paracoccus tegillarcae TaxID=1529068 RepID=A0A2K9EEU8_9RHOB|nr:Na+/H+ antiporter subunit G [Paracoccus tegillarcae]AUH32849.1 Na+/H+ antiporter subunit G [Paracoccus tegillarcae]